MLAGGHLLTVPSLAGKAESLTSRTDEVCRELAVLLGYRPEAVDMFGGISCLLEYYLWYRGIARDVNPLLYDASVNSYAHITEYLYEEDIQVLPDERARYIGLFFISENFTDDIGGDLEEIERRNPGLGAWLLARFDASPCNILTPAKIYDQADWLLGWDNDDRYSVIDDEMITPEKFEEYFPDWAYKRFDDPEPDFSPWPQLTELYDRELEYLDADSGFPYQQYERTLVVPEGWDMYSGAIAWTKGRNEIERDIGFRVCNELFNDMINCNGVNPGCMQFEFIMDRRNAHRNSLIAGLLDKFVRYLAALHRVFTDVRKGEFR